MDTAFRKIDIDIYDEDVLLESELYEPDPRDPGTVLNDAKQKQSAVRSFLSRYVRLGSFEGVTQYCVQGRHSRSSDGRPGRCALRSKCRRRKGT